MALSTGSLVLSSDMTSVLSQVNSTLSRYGVSQVTSAHGVGTTVLASYIQTIVSRLQTADNHSYNTAKQGTTLTNAAPAVGSLLKAATLTTINSCAVNIYNGYCSCNCNFCSCNCNFCSCNCNFCSCNCDDCYCSCNCNFSCFCSCNCNFSSCYYSLYYCDLATGYTCFLPDQYIITAQGPKAVQNVQNGDLVLTAFGEFDEVISTWSLDVEDKGVINYKGDSFDLTVTEDHYVSLDSFSENEEQKVYYPYLKTSSILPELKKDIKFSKEFLDNLIILGSNLVSFSSNIVTFKLNQSDLIIDICKKLITDNFKSTVTKSGVIISGMYNNIAFAQLFQGFVSNDKQIFPYWIYSLPQSYFKTWKEQIDNGDIIIESYEQYLQLKLILNSLGYDYKRDENNKMIFIKNLENNSNSVQLIASKYTGTVYNIQCKNEHLITGEIVFGDGYTF